MPDWFYTAYLVSLAVASLFCLSMVAYAWSRRTVDGATMLGWAMLATAGWSAMIIVSMVSTSAEAALVWDSQVRYAFIAAFPVAFLGFTLEYAQRGQWLTRQRITLLLVIPILIQLFNWIDPDTFFSSILYVEHNGLWIVEEYTPAWGFTLHTFYSYLLMLWGLTVLVSRLYNAPPLYKAQVLALLGGVCVPFAVNIVTITRLIDVPLVDWTAISFTVTGFIWTQALFRYRLFDLTPVAYERIVHSMEDAVIVIDRQNRVVDMNPAAEALTQHSAQQAIGQPIQPLFQNQATLLEQYLPLEKVRAEIMVESGPRYFDLQISTLYRRTTPTGRLVQLRDITARKAADLEREGLIDDLKAYAHTVAHDLKDPIGTIVMALDMLLYSSSPPPSEHQQRFLSMMASNARKTITIIDSLLLLAKVRDQEQIPVTATALVQSMSEAQKRLAASISAAQAEITVAQEWPSVLAYAPWVEEMWVNYLSNALKYGGTPPRIELGAQVEGRMVRCFVRDHGPGLSAAQQAELFIPFSQIDPKQAKGHGLGLSIVKRIAERLGGTVGVDSTPGQGSTFYFTLPAA